MILVNGDIFDSGEAIFAQGVNASGIIGSDLSLAFKKRFPRMFDDYRNKCLNKEFVPGDIHFFEENDKKIINMMVKDHDDSEARLDWIAMSAHNALQKAEELGYSYIAVSKKFYGITDHDLEIMRKLVDQVERNRKAQFKIYYLG